MIEIVRHVSSSVGTDILGYMKRSIIALTGTVVLALVANIAGRAVTQAGRIIFIGTYTGETSKGIYAFRFDDRSGSLAPLGLVAETPSPSYLAASVSGRFLFAVNEISSFNGDKSGSVTSFAADRATGKLTQISV